ncbi:MAG: insulinase family protein [Gemmatimonadetes bacterium]|nr:insulinase family protein [Gemmatimonadota bacterium]
MGVDTLDRSRVPGVAAPSEMKFPEIQDYRLQNGLRVVLWERTALPLVSLQLQFRGGASAHPAQKAGLAALTADMLDEGTSTRNALEIAGTVDLLGATLTSSAGYDASQVRLSILRDKLADGLAVMADIVMHPTFPESEFTRVRKERLDRVLQRSAEPAAMADDAFVRTLYGTDHPYGASLLGTSETLEDLVREDVESFFHARYAPGQATLVVVGDIERAALDSLLAASFAGWQGHGEDLHALPMASGAPAPGIYVVDKPGAAQSEVRVGYVAVDRKTPDYYPLTVLNTVLGGTFTSRLNLKLREEKGYTYGAGSAFDMRVAPGPFEAAAAVATPVTDSAVADFVEEIDRLSREDVPNEELERARNFLALRLPQRFESVDDVVRRLAELVLYDLPLGFYSDYVTAVQGVDAGAVRRAAERYLPVSRMIIVVAGDRKEVESSLASLDLGPVVVLGPVATPGASESNPSREE